MKMLGGLVVLFFGGQFLGLDVGEAGVLAAVAFIFVGVPALLRQALFG